MRAIVVSSFVVCFVLACAGSPPPPPETTEASDEPQPVEQEVQPKEEPKEPEPAEPDPDEQAGDPYKIYKDTRELPDTIVGKRVKEAIQAINSHDSKKIAAFVKETFADEFLNMAPMEMHVTILSSFYYESAGLEFYSHRTYEGKTPPDEHVFILTSKTTGRWIYMAINVEKEPPHKIKMLDLGAAKPPHEAEKPKDLSQKEIVARFKRYVAKLGKADIFSGSVLLAKDGKVLFKKAYGEASKRFQVPNKIDTKFNLGSMNKMFTSVATLQLIEQGKLSFDDPLSKFISEEWMPKSLADKIKIKHLLTHTSGLGSYFNDKFMNSSRLLFRDLDDYKTLIEVKELPFEPGSKFKYSNVGMFMLGVVIEKVTGISYFDYVMEHIYKPAGMINTDCYEMDRPVPNLAIGYSRMGDEWINNLYQHTVKGAAAGGGFSTVEDLLAFDIAIRNHKLLSAEMTEKMLTEKPEMNCPEYGYGFMVRRTPTDRIVGHGGGFTGIRASLDMFMDSGYTSIVLSNYDFGVFPIIFKAQELIAARKK